MKYFLIALAREDMEHCIKAGVFGLSRKQIIAKVAAGDKIACYVTKEYKIIALGEAVSDYYIDDAPVFKSAGMYIDRFKFKASKIRPELDFMGFVDKFSFIKKREYWSVYLRNGIVEMSDKDWHLIEAVVKT